MRRVYQPLATALAPALALLAACAGPAPAPLPAPPPRAWPLDVYLASRAYAPVAIDARGRVLATESGPQGERAVRLAAGGTPAPVAPALRADHRALAALAGDTVLVELAATEPGAAPVLALAGPGGVALPVTPAGAADRLLAVAADGERFWSARAAADTNERLVETGRLARTGRELLEAPPGFRFAAVAADGARTAMVRTVAPESDEVVVTERASGESRLVLPTGPEGRFRPLLFAADGKRLLVATDDASDLPRLEWLTLATGERAPALDTPCAAVGARAAGAALVADLSCEGRRTARPLAGGEPPWQGLLPRGLEVFAALPAGPDAWWLGLRGAASGRDLARLGADRRFAPATWALAPRLDPATLPAPALERLRSGGVELPVEIWRPAVAALGAVVWLESDAEPPAWGEFHPLFSGLAAHGIAVARLRPRGADGFGRALRAAAGDDPLASARADAEAALARLRAALAAPALPGLRVVEGALGEQLGTTEGAGAGPFADAFAVPAPPRATALAEAGRRALERLRAPR